MTHPTDRAGDDPMRDDHDAHLHAALRHAPDRDVAPSSALSQAIVRAARAATRPTQLALHSAAGPWRRLLALSAPRPALGGALAAVVVASLVVGMWTGHEVPQPIRRDGAAVDAAPATTPSRPVADAAGSAASPGPAAPTVRPIGQGRAADRAYLLERAAPPAPGTRELDAIARSAARSGALNDARRDSSGESSAPPAAMAAAQKAPSTGPAAAQQELRAQAPTQARAEVRAPSAAPAAPAAALRVAATPSASPVQTLLELTASAGAPWRWQGPEASGSAPLDREAAEWLQRLELVTRGRWVGAGGAAAGAATTPSTPAWRWWRADRLQASLQVEASGLTFTDAGGRSWFAPMSTGEIEALRRP